VHDVEDDSKLDDRRPDLTRRIYPRPPIVEAVIDLRFAGTVQGEQLADAIADKLGALYPANRTRQDRLEVAAAIDPDSVSASARRRPHLTFLSSADGLRRLGCGPGVLSVHVLAPYPGWERLLEQAREATGALPEAVREQPLEAIAVRYIDRIALPSVDVAFHEFITVMPPRPAGMPEMLAGFHVATQTVDPRDGTVALLTVASAPPEADGRAALIYDLNLQRAGVPLGTIRDEAWVTIVEELHQRQRAIFEDSITDKARELFA
jgi:uncharacterized protein (TIGR04255 family)